MEVVEEHSEGDLESVHSSANVVAELFREGIEFEDVSEEDGVLHESVDGRVKFGVFVVAPTWSARCAVTNSVGPASKHGHRDTMAAIKVL